MGRIDALDDGHDPIDEAHDLIALILAHLPQQGATADPLYMQLASAIRKLIDAGTLRGGEVVPSERVLMKATGMSRVTIRSAIDHLAQNGLVSRKQGAGSYVSPSIDQPLSVLMGFTADMARRGAATRSLIMSQGVGIPAPDEMLKLGISSNEEVFRLQRVRISNDEPLAIETAIVPYYAVGRKDIGASLYQTMRENGYLPARALQRLRAGIASETEARHLKIAKGSPILHIERHSFLPNGRPIEITKSSYRGDRYDFIAELKIDQ